MTTDTYGFRHGDDGYFVTKNGMDIAKCGNAKEAVDMIEKLIYGEDPDNANEGA